MSTRWSQSNLSTTSKVSFTKQLVLDTGLKLVHESCGVAETGVEMMTVEQDMVIKVRDLFGKSI